MSFTLEDYNNAIFEDYKIPKDERLGQRMFNILQRMNPEIANEIVGTGQDPFYDNSRIPDFMVWLTKRMGW